MRKAALSLSCAAAGSVLIGSAVAQTGSNREEGDVHTHNGDQVFWSAHAHDCPATCGIGTFMQTRSGALQLRAPSPSTRCTKILQKSGGKGRRPR